MPGSSKQIEVLQGQSDELKARLAGLETEQVAAREAVATADAAWRSALADDALGEGGKPAVKSARAALDSARENLLGIEGAVAEIGRRLSAAEVELIEARLAALVKRANRGTSELDRCVVDLLELEGAAGKVRERMQALIQDLLTVKAEHNELDPEDRSPGEIGGLSDKLWNGLACSPAGLNVRGHLLLAHVDLAEFLRQWCQGKSVRRVLG